MPVVRQGRAQGGSERPTAHLSSGSTLQAPADLPAAQAYVKIADESHRGVQEANGRQCQHSQHFPAEHEEQLG